jgi:hypothetical protein
LTPTFFDFIRDDPRSYASSAFLLTRSLPQVNRRSYTQLKTDIGHIRRRKSGEAKNNSSSPYAATKEVCRTPHFFLNQYFRKKALASTSARAYHSRRSYHHAANTDNKNWLPTNGRFFPQEVNYDSSRPCRVRAVRLVVCFSRSDQIS